MASQLRNFFVLSYQKIRAVSARPVGAAALIFIFAALLRLWLLPTAYYSSIGELYRDMEVIWNMFHYGQIPLLGPSSALGGFYFGAAYYYIEGLFVFLFRFVPYGAVFSSTFFSLLSLPLLYQLCRKWFTNPWVATLAVGIQSVALFDIQNSYYVSNPNYLPSFFLAMCLLLTYLAENPKTWQYAALGVVLGIATQLHATALVLMPVVAAAVVWRHRIKPTWKQAAITVGLWALCFTPYIVYELTHHFALARSLFDIGHREATGGGRLGIILGFINFFDSFFIFKDGAFNFYPGYPAAFFIAVGLAAAVVMAALWVSIRKHFMPSFRTLHPVARTILAAWFFGGFVMYAVTAVPPSFYYFIIMWPLPVLLAAWWLGSLAEVSKKDFAILLSGYAVLQLFCIGVFFKDVYRPEYSYADIQQAMAEIKSASAGKDYLVVNQALDVNQFLYYLRYNGLSVRSRPLLSGYQYFDLVLCGTSGMAHQQMLQAGGLCVKEARK